MKDNFKIGQHIKHSSLKKPRQIRHMKFNSSGDLLVGVGRKPTGFLFAKDCVSTISLKTKGAA